ncbi:hypothetical protein [Paenirhodobacter populi]|uniref:Uncharacterized protein n=1 Tax=Paenirhodobacter populi TaxID=2306993 RepID=A0A443IQU0_9RHOB|nr:hypothetical protein [Sinirhodobacter populi]RWR08540.1 hypothetical protein D2T33_15710 [Sinirhodobacter populi]
MIAKLKTWAAIAGAFVLALVAAFWRGRAQGSAAAQSIMKKKDAANAREIEDRADAARAQPVDDPVERLRASGRLRD